MWGIVGAARYCGSGVGYCGSGVGYCGHIRGHIGSGVGYCGHIGSGVGYCGHIGNGVGYCGHIGSGVGYCGSGVGSGVGLWAPEGRYCGDIWEWCGGMYVCNLPVLTCRMFLYDSSNFVE